MVKYPTPISHSLAQALDSHPSALGRRSPKSSRSIAKSLGRFVPASPIPGTEKVLLVLWLPRPVEKRDHDALRRSERGRETIEAGRDRAREKGRRKGRGRGRGKGVQQGHGTGYAVLHNEHGCCWPSSEGVLHWKRKHLRLISILGPRER